MKTQLVKVDVKDPKEIQAAASKAAKVVSSGGLVGFATETVYGIAALASNRKTMDRLREIKSRPENPFSVHLSSRDGIYRLIDRQRLPIRARWVIEKAWPGPVTLLLETGGKLAEAQLRNLHDVVAKNNIVGLRCPDEPLCSAMLAKVKGLVVAPSANLAGRPSPKSADDVMAGLDGKLDMVVDSGPAKYGRDSTILMFHGQKYTIIRQGVYDERMISNLAGRKIAFICTGNTCRSPLAEGLCEVILAEKLGCGIDELARSGIEIDSFGVSAWAGSAASMESVEIVSSSGGNISEHRSRKISADMIKYYDKVFCMTAGHLQQLNIIAGGQASNAEMLDSVSVSDPIGGGAAAYRRVAGQIERAIRKRIDDGDI